MHYNITRDISAHFSFLSLPPFLVLDHCSAWQVFVQVDQDSFTYCSWQFLTVTTASISMLTSYTFFGKNYVLTSKLYFVCSILEDLRLFFRRNQFIGKNDVLNFSCWQRLFEDTPSILEVSICPSFLFLFHVKSNRVACAAEKDDNKVSTSPGNKFTYIVVFFGL